MLKTVSSITNAIGALNYKGTWNASTNTPTLTSGSGTKGDYYVVSVAGSTLLDGSSNWGVGDWATYNGSIWQKVEGGNNGDFVDINATGIIYIDSKQAVNGPAFAAYGTAGQSITSGTWTKIAFNTEIYDTNSNYDPITNYRFTPTVGGYYQINANIFTTANPIGLAFISLYKNGSLYLQANTVPNSNGGYISFNGLVFCNGTTDYLEIYVLQNSGVNLTFGSSSEQFQFSGSMVRGE